MNRKRIRQAVLGIILLLWACKLLLRPSPYGRAGTWEGVTLTTDRAVYEPTADCVSVTVSTDTAEPLSAVWSPAHVREKDSHWALEKKRLGIWCSVKQAEIPLPWPDKGVVHLHDGEELRCGIGDHYASPLRPGEYRIVLPRCSYGGKNGHLAVEFTVAE